MSAILEVRPHGFHSRLGVLPAETLEQAYNLHRIFGGVIVHVETGVDYTPAKVETR